MRVSARSEASFAPSIEQFVMISSRGRGRGRGYDFGGHGCGSYGGRKSASEKGPQQCRHCGRSNHISEKCWEKFGRLEWAQLSDSGSPAPCGISQSSSYAIPGSFMVVLSQEYDRLRQLVFSQNDLSPTRTSASGMHVYTASPQKPWVLDSGVSWARRCV